mmetsp:Transcript_20741/g.29809  ORF Transcript_20741/g.29809 Transcript_20741/m.29809 type:complete len:629 (+) Transcript_20741:447-2333(+)
MMRTEKSRLQESDKPLDEYLFYRDAEEGYARDLSELTLHQALRYLMRVLEKEIAKNIAGLEAEHDLTLFHPPRRKLGENFYPEEVGKIKEYRDYFTKHAIKKDRISRAYQHKGSVRPEEAMSGYFRASKSGGLSTLYESDPKAGQSMHSKVGWKNIMSTGDDLAIADLKMAQRLEKVEKMMRKQGAWTNKQKESFVQTNERYTHMWHIIKEELSMEHDRERRLLTVDVNSNLEKTERDIWKERIDSADRIMATIAGYGLTNGTNEADYLLFCLKKWKEEALESRRRRDLRIAAGKANSYDKASQDIAIKKKRMMKRRQGRRKGKKSFVKSIVATRIGTPNDGEDDDDDDEEEELEEEAEGEKSITSDADVSLLSDERAAALKLTDMMQSRTDGGFHGLGFLSTIGAQEETADTRNCSAGVTARLLTTGPLSVFGGVSEDGVPTSDDDSQQKKQSRLTSTKKATVKKTVFVNHREEDKKMMQELSQTYRNIGMKRNIRSGKNTDLSTLTPALIPFHEVVSNKCPPEDRLQSYAADNAVHHARMKQVNPITGYVPQHYVPLYVRTTLFESNGATSGGDQTYATMAKDRRYSHQLGRAMASLEPIKYKKKKPVTEESTNIPSVKKKFGVGI